MKKIVLLFLLGNLSLLSQDKLYFTNGSIKSGIVISMARDFVFYKNSDTSMVQKIPKSQLVMVENYQGVRYLFAAKPEGSLAQKDSAMKSQKQKMYLGVQPFALILGRANFVFERINKKGNLGIAVPLILSFNPYGSVNNGLQDSSSTGNQSSGLGVIVGLDLNYYIKTNESGKFFIGPKFRYGTDVFFNRLEYYTLQTQVGWRFGKPNAKVVQHVALGYGFADIVSSNLPRFITTRDFYSLFSLTYRLSFKT